MTSAQGWSILADQGLADRLGRLAALGQAGPEDLDDRPVDRRVFLAVERPSTTSSIAPIEPEGVDRHPLDVLLGVVHRLDEVREDRPAGPEEGDELVADLLVEARGGRLGDPGGDRLAALLGELAGGLERDLAGPVRAVSSDSPTLSVAWPSGTKIRSRAGAGSAWPGSRVGIRSTPTVDARPAA